MLTTAAHDQKTTPKFPQVFPSFSLRSHDDDMTISHFLPKGKREERKKSRPLSSFLCIINKVYKQLQGNKRGKMETASEKHKFLQPC